MYKFYKILRLPIPIGPTCRGLILNNICLSKILSKSTSINQKCIKFNSNFTKINRTLPVYCHKYHNKTLFSRRNDGFSSREYFKGFHSSSVRNINPLVILVLRPISKFAAVLVGRGFRKWWRSLPKEKRSLLFSHLIRNKWRYMASFFCIGGSSFYIYKTHVSVTPYTQRKRFMMFDSFQIKKLSDFNYNQELEVVKDRLLPSNHPHVIRTKKTCEKLIRANRDIPEIYSKFWTVSVVDLPEENCKVFPSGQIVMYAGMLELTNNDDQIAIILAHEISHVILEHTAELFNYAALVDFMIIIPLALISALLPNDGVALLSLWFFKRVVDTILHLPYSRKLETEADTLGIFLAASACFDIREASAFWGRLDLMEKYRHLKDKNDTPDIAFLSTHPSHGDRQDHLDQLMDNALKTREGKKCPLLNKIDPRESVKSLQEQYERKSDKDNLSSFRKAITN